MKKKLVIFLVLWLLVLACQVIPTPPPLTPAPAGRNPTPTAALPGTPVIGLPGQPTSLPGEVVAPTFELTAIDPFPEQFFADTTLISWELTDANVNWYDLPVDLQAVANPGVLAGLTNAQKRYLAQHGFLLIEGQESDFSTIRHKVSTQYGQPYFLTTDAAGYALKSTADALLLTLEKEIFSRRLSRLVQSTLLEVQSLLPGLQGSALEKDARLAQVYLSVGLHLLEPSAEILLEPDLESLYLAQVNQVLIPSDSSSLLILPGVRFDFDVFEIPDYYRGDETLEAYFRGKTWFEQVGFPIDDQTGIMASRVPLITTLALRRASIDGQPTAQAWAELDETMSFFYGRSQDDDPRRYAQLMDRVYGNKISPLALADEKAWQTFRVLAQTLPVSPAYAALAHLAGEQSGVHDWRFLGRRFYPDTPVFSALPIFRDHTPDLPHASVSGLDWMAASGRQQAEEILDTYLITQMEAYATTLKSIQAAVQSQGEHQWQSAFWSAWNYAFLPSKTVSMDMYPPFMRHAGWMDKDLTSALGSWVLSHHRSGPAPNDVGKTQESPLLASGPAPAYVQPLPEVYYRLSYLANVILDGLAERGLTGAATGPQGSGELEARLQEMRDLGDRLARLGDIAVKEFQGLALDSNDFALIQAPMGSAEIQNQYILAQRGDETTPVAAVATPVETGDQVLHAGIGRLDWLYVIVPLNAELHIAQGGVFSYYEFNQPFSEKLDDEAWDWIVLHAQPSRPAWSQPDILAGGVPYSVLAFRIGDVYQIKPSGANLSVRSVPSRNSTTVKRLRIGETVQIIDGPVLAEGSIWWKVSILDIDGDSSGEGWVIESQDWFERAWGQ